MLNHHDSFYDLFFDNSLFPFNSEIEASPSLSSIVYNYLNQEQPEMLAPQRDRSLVTIPRIRDPSFQIFSPNTTRVSNFSLSFLNRGSMVKKYGKPFIITVKKMVREGLFFLPRIGNIYKKVLDAYVVSIGRGSSILIKKFISCLPKASALLRFSKKEIINEFDNYKDVLFCKIALDLYDDYYAIESISKEDEVDSMKMFYKAATAFYSAISPFILSQIQMEIATMSLKFYECIEQKKYIEMSKSDFISRYHKLRNEMLNLYGGYEMSNKSFIQ